MASLPVEILLGVYLGVLTGVIPTLVAWGLGFGFRYLTGVTIPGFAVVVLSVALAGVNGGLLALADQSIVRSANAPTVLTSILVVTGAALYAHARGDQMGATMPRRFSLKRLREQTLSPEVVELVGGRGEVQIEVVGEVADVEGYPPLPEDLRAEIRGVQYSFPADLQVTELEERFAERLRTEFDLGDVVVAIDERGRADVAAAPPFSGLSKRVPAGRRAISIDALLPTGLARGDEVRLEVPDPEAGSATQASGTVLSARSGGPDSDGGGDAPVASPDAERRGVQTLAAPTTDGGEGRLTVAVSRADAERLVRTDRARVVVEPRGTHYDYELVGLLRREGQRIRRLTLRAGGALDGATLGDTNVREAYGVAVLAVRSAAGWRVSPDDSVSLQAGDELYAVGPPASLDALTEAAA
jgi:hypothetical protein